MEKEHYNWLDWMKVTGMYFIIAGHFSPVGYGYIYTFSVPLFFAVSGFLTKREETRVFWKKLFSNLILPCILICLILHIYQIVTVLIHGGFSWIHIPKHILNCVAGFHGLGMDAGGLGVCWFIYSLIICKIIYQYVSVNKLLHFITLGICLSGAIVYNMLDIHLYNALFNVSLAYPFFLIGRGYKELYDRKPFMIDAFTGATCFFICCLLVFIVEKYNGIPWMYDNVYGNNIFLFFVGGNAGLIAVFIISRFLDKVHIKPVSVLSRGMIIILGFHLLLIRLWDYFSTRIFDSRLEYLGALFVLLAFIPIIRLTEMFLPMLLGTRAKK